MARDHLRDHLETIGSTHGTSGIRLATAVCNVLFPSDTQHPARVAASGNVRIAS